MTKPVFVNENGIKKAASRTSVKAVEEGLPVEMKSSASRFPPIENALTEIIKNKRLTRTQDNV